MDETKIQGVSEQPQSPFFRLPRELRDLIYEAYEYDNEGCHYEYSSRTLRYATEMKHYERSGFRLTCRAVAAEMQGSRLLNTINFRCALSPNSGPEYKSLSRAAGLVSSMIIDKVASGVPQIQRWYRAVIKLLQTSNNEVFKEYTEEKVYEERHRGQMSSSFLHALQQTLELVSSHAAFDDVAARSCTDTLTSIGYPSSFFPGSHMDVLSWNPTLWELPSDETLALGAHLTDLNIMPQRGHNGFRQAPEPWAPMDHYYSATALAINFLSGLPLPKRLQLRRLRITEDRRGVAAPECHCLGLLPYLREHPKLRVKIQIGFWTNLVDPFWSNHRCASPQGITKTDFYSILVRFADWVDNISRLASSGVQDKSIKFILDGHGAETQEIWAKVKFAAGLQEVMNASRYGPGGEAIDLSSFDIDIGYIVQPPLIPADRDALDHGQRIQLPTDLPSSFAPMIRNIINNTGPIRFDGEPGELWDFDGMFAARREWSFYEFWEEWRESVQQAIIPLPPGGSTRYLYMYNLAARDAAGRRWDDPECDTDIPGWLEYAAPVPET